MHKCKARVSGTHSVIIYLFTYHLDISHTLTSRVLIEKTSPINRNGVNKVTFHCGVHGITAHSVLVWKGDRNDASLVEKVRAFPLEHYIHAQSPPMKQEVD